MNTLRQRLIGAILCLALLALALGVVPAHVADGSPAAVLARVLDSLAPQLLVGALALAVVAAVLGAWRAGMLAAMVTLAFAGWFGVAHLQRALPLAPAAEPVARVLFFNTLATNDANADRIAAAIEASDADVVALAESAAVRSALPRLRKTYPHVLGCERGCAVTVLSKRPFVGEPSAQPPAQWEGRLRQVQVDLGGGEALTLVALQAAKPWTLAPAERGATALQSLLHDIAGPVLVAGDFNAAPWARPMRALLDDTGLRAARLPLPTWPVGSGWAGVPIDNFLVRGGARLVSLHRFGRGLGSNHLGLVAEVALGG
ncbi:endonuclease/exonuclease/phosphatase family protein [Frigidibacter sp. MR17.24]|uniref:endonuclease/exonuclease/phosphatase family protein n=1 Tax=Frigidibacter sp. MR17.24 TaxID=3127345 RepID=UPI003012D56C